MILGELTAKPAPFHYLYIEQNSIKGSNIYVSFMILVMYIFF